MQRPKKSPSQPVLGDGLFAELSKLRQIGADRFNPARFQLIHTLIVRSAELRPVAEQLLLQKARLELDSYQADLGDAQQNAEAVLYTIGEHAPGLQLQARRCVEQFDFLALARLNRRQLQQKRRSTDGTDGLTGLTQSLVASKPTLDKQSTGLSFDEYLQQQDSELIQGLEPVALPGNGDRSEEESLPELRSNRVLRQTRLKEKAEKMVNSAIEESPVSPGPLNPQMLSIRALKGMRDLSPQYLNRLVTYIDSLLWIEKAGEKFAPGKGVKKHARAKPRKKAP